MSGIFSGKYDIVCPMAETEDTLQLLVMSVAGLPDYEHPDVVEIVPASQLPDHLAAVFPEDVPSDRRARFLSSQAMERCADFSLNYPKDPDFNRYVAHYLQLAEPWMDSTKSLGKLVDEQLKSRERPSTSPVATADLLYCTAVFTTLAPALVPRFGVPVREVSDDIQNRAAALARFKGNDRRYKFTTPDVIATEALVLDALMRSPGIRSDYKRCITRMRAAAGKLAVAHGDVLDRIREIMPVIQFESLPETEEPGN